MASCLPPKIRLKEPLYLVFLDLTKAYDSLDRQRTLQLLEKYGVGQNVRTLINNMWSQDTIIPKQQQFYGKQFKAERGVRQGDIVSPTIFNIVMDAVVRNCYNRLWMDGNYDMMLQFYADDGIIAGENYEQIQQILNQLKENFSLYL